MLYIPKIGDFTKMLTKEKVKNFVSIIFNEYFISKKQEMYSKLTGKQNFRKGAESLYIFLTTNDEVEKYVEIMESNSSDNWVHHYNVDNLILIENCNWLTLN